MPTTTQDNAPSLRVATPSAGFQGRRNDRTETRAVAQHECKGLVPVGAVMLPVRRITQEWEVCGDLSDYLIGHLASRSVIADLPVRTDKNFVNLQIEFDFDDAAWCACDGLLVLFILNVTPPESIPESALAGLGTTLSPNFDKWKRAIEAALKQQGARPLDGGVLQRP